MTKTIRTTWSDELLEQELRTISAALGRFPSAPDLRLAGRNDVACAATRRGGLVAWARKLGLERARTDFDVGREGEEAFHRLCTAQGIDVVAMSAQSVKCPYDLLLDGVLRVDVKTTRLKTYGRYSGWHFQIGKHPQADVLVLLQADSGSFVALPCWVCPTGGVTICRGGGKYAAQVNDWATIRRMINTRKLQRPGVSSAAAA